MDKIQIQDIQEFVDTFKLTDELCNSSFLITGATGLIGSTLIHCLLALDCGIRIVAPVRNMQKAYAMFEEEAKKMELIE